MWSAFSTHKSTGTSYFFIELLFVRWRNSKILGNFTMIFTLDRRNGHIDPITIDELVINLPLLASNSQPITFIFLLPINQSNIHKAFLKVTGFKIDIQSTNAISLDSHNISQLLNNSLIHILILQKTFIIKSIFESGRRLVAFVDMEFYKTWNVDIWEDVKILTSVQLNGVIVVERQKYYLLMVYTHWNTYLTRRWQLDKVTRRWR